MPEKHIPERYRPPGWGRVQENPNLGTVTVTEGITGMTTEMPATSTKEPVTEPMAETPMIELVKPVEKSNAPYVSDRAWINGARPC